MKIFWTLPIALVLLFVGQEAYADSSCTYQPRGTAIIMAETPGSIPIRHGVNLSRWWQDDQDRALTLNEIRQIHDSGFDFVRLPVSPAWLEIKDQNEQREKLEALRCDIISLLNENLTVVLDLHGSDAFQDILHNDPNEAVPRVETLWGQLKQVVDGLPPRLVFLSLYNEPLVETNLWWRIQGRIIEDLRNIFPDNTFIVSSGPFNGWWQLANKKPYTDGNIIYDFHFYDPMIFTHHGAEWLKSEPISSGPITYPVTKDFKFDMSDPDIQKYVEEGWNQAAISKIIKDVVTWRDHRRVRVACLEFGVYRAHVDDESRYHWLHDVHAALEDAHIPWALWEYKGPFGLVDKQGVLDNGMLDALGLKHSRMP